MPTTINLPLITSILAALAGAAGTILTPLYGNGLATTVQAVIQAISALLVVIPVTHASSVAAHVAKAKADAALAPHQ